MSFALMALDPIESPAEMAPLRNQRLVDESMLPNILHVSRLSTWRLPKMKDASTVTMLTTTNEPSCPTFVGHL